MTHLHGWLVRNSDGWQARLAFDDMDEEPWYSPSCGRGARKCGRHTRSSVVGDGDRDTDQVSDDDEWQPPVVLILQHRDASSESVL